MNKTDIDWATASWNPVTGCLYGCDYCYAKNQARRFSGHAPSVGTEKIFDPSDMNKIAWTIDDNGCIDLRTKLHRNTKKGKSVTAAYPFGFVPTLHRVRLGELAKKKKPQNIFVGSMCDLFGYWVPDGWIKAVFDVCEAAPQHNYLFLTKNPNRYSILNAHCKLPRRNNFFYGTTVTTQRGANASIGVPIACKRFLSIEPIMERINSSVFMDYDWVIIGAETGKRKSKVTPHREWIVDIVNYCHASGVPVFMKSSLADIWGEHLIQEYPPELLRNVP